MSDCVPRHLRREHSPIPVRGMSDRLLAQWLPRPEWRASLLPAAAGGFLLVGALAWLSERVGGRGALSDRVWYAGLLLTGVPVVLKALREIGRGHFATDLVAMLAVLGALILDEPLAGLVIVLMQTGGEALERFAEGRASAAVRELEAAAPRLAHRLRDNLVEDVPADAVVVGDILLIRPGELVPCDVVVLSGRSDVDVSRLTGEPMPLSAGAGVTLLSGSGNGRGPLTVRATAIARESQYARIVQLVRSAQENKSPLQRLADRYAVWFTPATLLVCAIAWLSSGDPKRALAVLVVATPCPLILATPIAIIGGINRAARRQIIVRHGGALEQVGATTVAIFDKTGTLTGGQPAVARVVPASGWTEGSLLRFAGAVEHVSGHLLARMLVVAAERTLDTGSRLPVASDVVDSHGRGVRGRVEGHMVTVGSRSYTVEQHGSATAGLDALEMQFTRTSGLRAYVAIDGEAAGIVEYADRVRSDARTVIATLRSLGIGRVLLLSGDHEQNVRSIATEVGITEAHADMLPDHKAEMVRSLVESGERVLMVGDGTNDAPAMSTATVGVSLAAHGGGITAEAADIVILADELSRVPEIVQISRRTMRIALQSLALGLGLSALAMTAAAFGRIDPPVGALLQELIDVAAILNALRSARGGFAPARQHSILDRGAVFRAHAKA